MERATGFEPATSTLARWRATNCAKPATQEVIYVRGTAVASENRKKFRPGEKSLLRAEKNFVKRPGRPVVIAFAKAPDDPNTPECKFAIKYRELCELCQYNFAQKRQ